MLAEGTGRERASPSGQVREGGVRFWGGSVGKRRLGCVIPSSRGCSVIFHANTRERGETGARAYRRTCNEGCLTCFSPWGYSSS